MSEADSLIPAGGPVEEPAAGGDESDITPAAESSWLWNEDQPGSGDAPEWFKGAKYKSVAEQAKAYNDLEGKFGAFTGAPDEYEIPDAESFADSVQLPEGVEFSLDKDDPLLQSFSEQAKEMGINQEGFNKLVGLYIQQQVNDYSEGMTNAEEERKQLGDNADARLQNIAKWGQANLDPETYEKLAGLATTADAVQAIEALIGKTRNAPVADLSSVAPKPGYSEMEVKAMQGEKDENGQLKIMTDPLHRAKVEKAFKTLYGEEPFRQTIGG